MTGKGSAERYVLSHIDSHEPYLPGTQPKSDGWIKLNTNENPYPPSPRVEEAIRSEIENIPLYPNPQSMPLREAIALFHDLAVDQVIVGNGSDDILNLLVRCFSGPARPAGTMDPEYSLYPVLSGLQNAPLITIPYGRAMELDREKILHCGANIFFLSSPNAPTGIGVKSEELSALSHEFEGLLVVDEAYAGFAPESAISLLGKHDNLVVVRTFSKSHSLAGLRVGFALASSTVIRYLDRARDSYNVNRLSQVGALAALEDRDYYGRVIGKIVKSRETIIGKLRARGWFTYSSQANFIFSEPIDANGSSGEEVARSLYDFLFEKRILVRHLRGNSLTASFLRISIGSEGEMLRFIENVDRWRQDA